MLKGLARWLRASGYDAFWRYGIDDTELVELAVREGRVVLTSDGPLMNRRSIKNGCPQALFIPRHLTVAEQLRFVLTHFALHRRTPRCMKCGGQLEAVPKESVKDEAPPRTFRWLDDFYRCLRCGSLFWKGSHWERIQRVIDDAGGPPEHDDP